MSTETEERERRTARTLAAAITKAGYSAVTADHGYAVRIYREGTADALAVVWMPIGEPTPTGMGELYLWGRTGDEWQAPRETGLDDLVRRIVGTLS